MSVWTVRADSGLIARAIYPTNPTKIGADHAGPAWTDPLRSTRKSRCGKRVSWTVADGSGLGWIEPRRTPLPPAGIARASQIPPVGGLADHLPHQRTGC